MTAEVLLIGLQVPARERLEAAAKRAAGSSPRLEPCGRDEALERLARHPSGVCAVLVGDDDAQPLELAQRIARADEDVHVLLVTAPETLEALEQQLIFTPFLGPQVSCRSTSELAAIGGELAELARATAARRRHRAALASAAPIAASSMSWRAPIVHYWDQLVEQAPLGIALVDDRATILAGNSRLGALLDQPPDALVGQSLLRVVSSAEGAHWKELVAGPIGAKETRQARLSLHTGTDERFVDATLVGVDAAREGEASRALLLIADSTQRVQAEQDVRIAKARLELALAAGRMGIWDWDLRRGALVTWSPEVCELHGIDPSEFPEGFGDYLALVHPDDRARLRAALEAATRGASDAFEIEYRIVRPDGRLRWVESRGRLGHDRAGRVTRMRGVLIDVTERAEAAAAVVRSEAFHAATLMSVGDAVLAVDEDGRVTLMNAVAERLTAWSLVEALGQHVDAVLELVDERTRLRVENPIERALRTRVQTAVGSPILLRRRDGLELSVDDSAAPIRGRGGDVLGAVMVFRDVTLRRREELWSSLQVTAREALAVHGGIATTLRAVALAAVSGLADWCVIELADEARLGGLANHLANHREPALAAELERLVASSLALSLDERPEPLAALAETTVAGGARLASVVDDTSAMASDLAAELAALGLRSWLVVAIGAAGSRPTGALLLASGSLQRFSGADVAFARRVGEDLGVAVERARAEVERERLLDELRRAVHFSQLFVGVLGHDLRNPLSAIVTSAQLLEARALRAERDEGGAPPPRQLKRIISSGHRMARMIEQLLDLTRVRLGEGIPIAPAELDLGALCRQVVDELQAAHAERTLELEVQGDLVGAWDGDRLAQVVSNLGSNAIEHGDPGAPVRFTVDGSAADAVRIAVHNAGAIPEPLVPHIFDPFRRAQLRERGSAGLGLGLYITREIAEAHGGSVTVESSAQQGTCFAVRLPRRAAARPG